MFSHGQTSPLHGRMSASAMAFAAIIAAFALPFASHADGGVRIAPLSGGSVATFAQILSNATGRPFAVAGDVESATFSILLPSNQPLDLPADDAYAFGLSVLTSAGLSVIEEGNACRIVRLPDGGGLSVGASATETNDVHGLVTRVFRLKHVAADDVRRILEGGSGKKGWIAVLETSNHLVVTDTAKTLERVASLVEEIDQPGLSRKTEIVKLSFADAESLAEQLNAIASQALQSEGARLAQRLGSQTGAVVPPSLLRAGVAVAAPRSNSLILVGQESQIAEFKELIAKLDIDAPTGYGNLNFIPLEYLKAEDTAKMLASLLEKSAGQDQKGARRIAVEANVVNNALVVDAAPNDFQIVRQLVQNLDKAPGQVHVSLLIAEVTDGNGFTWDPSFTVLDVANRNGATRVAGGSRLSGDTSSIIPGAAQGMLPQGLTAAMSHNAVSFDANGNLVSGSFPGIVSIEALKSDSKIKIISETALQAQNNIEAEVKIVDDIPYLKSSVEGSGSDRDYIQNVDRMEVGVTLRFTPYIVSDGTVRMVLQPTIASVLNMGADSLNPTIAKRSANTTVTVPDGNTIVIAGLTKTATKRVERRIPILGSIPLLGWLFRYKSDSEETTNLLIFVTPTIIATPADASAPSATWREKTGIDPDGR